MLDAPPIALPTLLTRIDAAVGAERTEGAWLLRVEGEGSDLNIGLLELDANQHPLDGLLGFRADPSWQAVGLICHGKAYRLDPAGPSHGADRRIRAIHAVTSGGAEASLLTYLDDPATSVDPGPSQGRLSDCCRRILGLETVAPEHSVRYWFATAWLSAVLAHSAQHPHRPLSWRQIIALHPAAGVGHVRPDRFAAHIGSQVAGITWESLRSEFRSGAARFGDLSRMPDALLRELLGDLTPEVAEWMDEGIFARWLVGALPDPIDLVVDLADLLPQADFDALTTVLRCWEMW